MSNQKQALTTGSCDISYTALYHNNQLLIYSIKSIKIIRVDELLKLKNTPKSPLRYAGGKSRGVVEISRFIPQDIDTICSPFFGGGSVELACAQRGIAVYGYDTFKPLVEFWQCLLKNKRKLAKIIKNYYPLLKQEFYELQKYQNNSKSKYKRAAIFYVLNRSSFSGTTLSGGMSPNHPRFTPSSIERVENFHIKNLRVNHADFTNSIPKSKNILLYLDPPYLINQKLYGNNGDLHEQFDHMKLVKILHNRDNWILSYNDSKQIRELYKGYGFYLPQWKYGMSNNKTSKEILLFSHDLTKKFRLEINHGITNTIR